MENISENTKLEIAVEIIAAKISFLEIILFLMKTEMKSRTIQTIPE